jgi:hypothetical protein
LWFNFSGATPVAPVLKNLRDSLLCYPSPLPLLSNRILYRPLAYYLSRCAVIYGIVCSYAVGYSSLASAGYSFCGCLCILMRLWFLRHDVRLSLRVTLVSVLARWLLVLFVSCTSCSDGLSSILYAAGFILCLRCSSLAGLRLVYFLLLWPGPGS